MLRDGGYAEASKLAKGASLMPFYASVDKDGYLLIRQPATGNCQSIRSHVRLLNHRRSKHRVLENHRVVSVRELQEREDVYCLAVPEHHNFALAAGVFV